MEIITRLAFLRGKLNIRPLLNTYLFRSTSRYSINEIKGYIKDLKIIKYSYLANVKHKIGIPNPKTVKRAWYLCVSASAVFIFLREIACPWILEGQSNEPTFGEGDILLVCVMHQYLFLTRKWLIPSAICFMILHIVNFFRQRHFVLNSNVEILWSLKILSIAPKMFANVLSVRKQIIQDAINAQK